MAQPIPPTKLFAQLCHVAVRAKGLEARLSLLINDTRHRRCLSTAATDMNIPSSSSPPSSSYSRRRPLPLSPLMDPRAIAAREKYHKRKPKQLPQDGPDAVEGDAQRQLQANPFAAALETPVRMCAITGARLPRFFLIPFHLLSHPETGAPWLLPEGIQPICSTSPDSKTPHKQRAVRPATPRSYVVARYSILKTIGFNLGTRTKIGWGMLLSPAMMGLSEGAQKRRRISIQRVVWREDMPDFVLGLLRERVASELRRVGSTNRGLIVADYRTEEGDGQIVAVLRLPASAGVSRDTQTDASSTSLSLTKGPGQEASSSIPAGERAGVATFDLQELLGEQEVAAVRTALGAELEGDHELLVKLDTRTREALMWLWKLQGFLAD